MEENVTKGMTEQDVKIHHVEMVARLKKKGQAIIDSLTPGRVGFLKSKIQDFVTEGNDFDFVKKEIIYNKHIPEFHNGIDGVEQYKDQHYTEEFDSLTPEKADLIHMAMGIAGEGIEILAAVYEHVFNDCPVGVKDRTDFLEELGDAEFFLEGVRTNPIVNIMRTHALKHNIEKLDGGRYKKGYSDKAAQERADKNV